LALEKIKGVTIVWGYYEGDDDMEEMGRELSEMIDLPFKFETF
jgi:hypothetical protein